MSVLAGAGTGACPYGLSGGIAHTDARNACAESTRVIHPSCTEPGPSSDPQGSPRSLVDILGENIVLQVECQGEGDWPIWRLHQKDALRPSPLMMLFRGTFWILPVFRVFFHRLTRSLFEL